MKNKIKRLDALLKLNIIEGLDCQKEVIKLFNELIEEGYPKELLKAKLNILKNNFKSDRALNNFLKGVKALTLKDVKFRNEIKKLQELGFDYFM